MGMTSPSDRVRARKKAIARVAERAAFAREQRAAAPEVVPEEEAPAPEGEGDPA